MMAHVRAVEKTADRVIYSGLSGEDEPPLSDEEGRRDDIVRKAIKRQQQNVTGGTRQLRLGDEVWLRKYGGQDKWVAGKITEKITEKSPMRLASTSSLNEDAEQRSQLYEAPSPGHSVRDASAIGTEASDGSDNQEEFRDCQEQPVQSNTQLPELPPEPPQSRPFRQCRINNPPRYKF
ncbi:unnamed protein product, partial [Iphiclides podalirius]